MAVDARRVRSIHETPSGRLRCGRPRRVPREPRRCGARRLRTASPRNGTPWPSRCTRSHCSTGVERPKSSANNERRLGRYALVIRCALTGQISCYPDSSGILRISDGGSKVMPEIRHPGRGLGTGGLSPHSPRSAVIGSTAVARCAGTADAAIATRTRRPAAVADGRRIRSARCRTAGH